MRYFIKIVAGFFFAVSLFAADRPSAPKDAKTTDDIVKAVEPFKGYGSLETAQFSRWGRRVFAVWYCPFSGLSACYLHAYYFDPKTMQWIRFIDKYVHGPHDLSAEMPTDKEVIIFRGTDGKVAVEESVAKFPYKKWYEDKK